MRNSSIELLRIIAMIMVILLHANYFSLGGISQNDMIVSKASAYARIVMEYACLVCVNIFVIISGWFGIKPSVKGFCSLIFQTIFYSLLIIPICYLIKLDISIKDIFLSFYFGSAYWFIPAYLILYAISPVINLFIDKVSPKQCFYFVVLFFVLEIIWGYVYDVGNYRGGYSAISFIGLYSLSRFIKLHGSNIKRFKVYIFLLIYLISILISTILSAVGIWHFDTNFHLLQYNSPLVIISSLCLFMVFTKFNIKSHLINWFSTSVFASYIIHQHPLLVPVFVRSMTALNSILSLGFYFVFVIIGALIFILLCAALDKVRILIYTIVYNYFIEPIYKRIILLLNKLFNIV